MLRICHSSRTRADTSCRDGETSGGPSLWQAGVAGDNPGRPGVATCGAEVPAAAPPLSPAAPVTPRPQVAAPPPPPAAPLAPSWPRGLTPLVAAAPPRQISSAKKAPRLAASKARSPRGPRIGPPLLAGCCGSAGAPGASAGPAPTGGLGGSGGQSKSAVSVCVLALQRWAGTLPLAPAAGHPAAVLGAAERPLAELWGESRGGVPSEGSGMAAEQLPPAVAAPPAPATVPCPGCTAAPRGSGATSEGSSSSSPPASGR
mmetsp:Transcript_118263/g.329838  ORF Transcript_118263/g.329838 Transcript_118263/m.329838 type:complete len:259 (-) Transcript_118263:309-1085(-)